MNFTVLKDFTDLESGKVYRNGGLFPDDDRELNDDRINALASSNNKIGDKLIGVNEEMTKKELEQVADILEVEYDSSIKKAELIELLRK